MGRVRAPLAICTSTALVLSGCNGSLGLGGAPTLSRAPERAVVQLSDIINNMKCDMLAFMRDNQIIRERGGTIGGTLKFNIDRSHERTGGLKAVGIPIVEGVTIGGELKGGNKAAFGEIVSTPFTITYSAGDAAHDIPCEPENRTVRVVEKGAVRSTPARLTGPLLDLRSLRQQLDQIQQGNPTVQFADFTFSGSVVLTRTRNTGFDINVVWLNPTVANNVASTYKIEYEIGTNWKAILDKAGYQADDPVFNKSAAGLKSVSNATAADVQPGRSIKAEASVTGRLSGRLDAPPALARLTEVAPARSAAKPSRASWLRRIADCKANGVMAQDARGVRMTSKSAAYARIRQVCRRDPATYPAPGRRPS